MSSQPSTRRAPADFLNDRVRSIPPSGIRRFFDMLNEMKDVISLTIGEPDFTTPEPITRAAIASLEAGETHYTANGGMIELRELIGANLRDRYAVEYDPRSEILITVGASEGVDAALRATINAGDEIIHHEPCFVAYAPCIQLAGGEAIGVSTTDDTDFRVTAQMIEAAITPRTKGIFLGYPNNPTGAVLDRSELEAIARVADEHDLLVYSDEIYDRLVYGDHEHVAFSSLPGMRERTVLLGGFSKSYAMTGWRIGWVAAPAELMAGIAKVHQYGIMCAPTSAQYAGHRGTAQWRAAPPGHARRVRPAPSLHHRSLQRDRPPHLRADGRLLLLPARDRCDRPRRVGLRRAAARRGARGRRARLRVRAVRRRARPGLLRHRLRGDRRGDGPHRAIRGASPRMSASPAQRFGAGPTAAAYAATMAPALRPIAAEVVRRAVLAPGSRVIDIGTGTGTAAAMARGDGRAVVGIDAAPGMLAIARETVAGVVFEEMDFAALSFSDASFDAVLAVHAFHFATDREGVLREWRRVAVPGARLSLSVPGRRRRVRTPSTRRSTAVTA